MKTWKLNETAWLAFWPALLGCGAAWLLMNPESPGWIRAVMYVVFGAALASGALLTDVWRRRVAQRRVRARVRERARAHKAACEFAGSQEAKPTRVYDELPLTPEEMVAAKERLARLAGQAIAEHFEKQGTPEEESDSDEVIWEPKEQSGQ